MQISIIVVMGERREFDLEEVGPCYADDDVIYFAGIPCVLSSAEPAPSSDQSDLTLCQPAPAKGQE